jgi:hypothetical protein
VKQPGCLATAPEWGKRRSVSCPPNLNRKRAAKRLGRLCVKVVTGAMVENIDDGGVIVAGRGSKALRYCGQRAFRHRRWSRCSVSRRISPRHR